MKVTTRLLASIFALAAFVEPAGATDVALQLDSVTVEHCTCDLPDCYGGGYGYYYNVSCAAPVARVLSPQAPQGGGSIELDVARVLIGGAVSLESHTEDGIAVGPWTRTVARRDPDSDAGFLAFTGWGDATFVVTSFTDQGAFAARLTNAYSVPTPAGEDRLVETYSLATVPGGSPPACPGERLYFDADSDGEEDATDLTLWGDSRFGTRVDGDGRTIADFCAIRSGDNRGCRRSDFLNDEPVRKIPRDCSDLPKSNVCAPAEYAASPSPAAFSGRTCQGFPVVTDTDGDSEGDPTDRCASTPVGAAIDADGCSAEQFCRLQPLTSCRRADFLNDEPLVKRSHDCQRVQQQCSARLP